MDLMDMFMFMVGNTKHTTLPRTLYQDDVPCVVCLLRNRSVAKMFPGKWEFMRKKYKIKIKHLTVMLLLNKVCIFMESINNIFSLNLKICSFSSLVFNAAYIQNALILLSNLNSTCKTVSPRHVLQNIATSQNNVLIINRITNVD